MSLAAEIETIIVPRTEDVGNFEVRRALPSRLRRMVGPFIFWDQMGPGEFITGQGVDVRPHPHIGLSTLTYLFDGALTHRDSLSTVQDIHPGDVNLMTAGRGISHSERTTPAQRQVPHRLYGIQSWLALPKSHEVQDPAFTHLPQAALPRVSDNGLDIRVISGQLFGVTSPLQFPHHAVYADMHLQAGAQLALPRDVEELALYPLSGRIRVGDTAYDPMQLLVLKPQAALSITAETDLHVMLLGGATMDGPRNIWWNFVSSSKESIEEAKAAWKNRTFPQVPAEPDYIPLPE